MGEMQQILLKCRVITRKHSHYSSCVEFFESRLDSGNNKVEFTGTPYALIFKNNLTGKF